MVLLSVKAGLRAKEIAMVTWGMVTDAEGNVGDALHLLNGASKGGRTVPLNSALRDALIALKARRNGVEPSDRIIHSERDIGMSPGAVQVWFHRLYNEKLGLDGASSHSGRRTFVTRCAKNIVAAGGSLRDVQELAGHASLATTQRTFKATRQRSVGWSISEHPVTGMSPWTRHRRWTASLPSLTFDAEVAVEVKMLRS
jgi:integrase/recombinase XerD